ncbi:hypothetical protein BU16DRAFT_579980 [Lophium mytilinum]|uniref:BTB domain-containing protein n=1 Tax=Lophium mytilinum TaxID=390894 RepID=A0A6A6R658_9PEZI|nr:hypothetical protein BU16DRAFT_579980 [Lophium mytilinum]
MDNDNSSNTSTIDDHHLHTPPEETYIVDPEGDLRVSLYNFEDEEKATYLVSAPCLRRASRVWRSMLNDSPLDLKLSLPMLQVGDFDINEVNDLPQMDETVLLLFNIAHAKFDTLPETLRQIEIWTLVLLCHKYDTVELIRPFLRAWVLPYVPRVYSFHNIEIWPFVFWAMGYQNAFVSCAGAYATSYYSGLDDMSLQTLMPRSIYKALSLSTPMEALRGHLERVRERLFYKIQSTCDRYIDSLSSQKYPKANCVCGVEDSAFDCDSIALGSLLIIMRRDCLMSPNRGYFNSKISITEVMKALTRADLTTGRALSYETHIGCDVNERFHKDIECCLKNVDFLSNNLRRHFATFKLRKSEKNLPQWEAPEVLHLERKVEGDTEGNAPEKGAK